MIDKKEYSFEIKKVSLDKNNEKGYFSGFASTPHIDSNKDTVNPAAFIDWLQRKKERSNKNKKVKILFNHDENKVIGGVPIDNINISEKGLEIKNAELILTVPKAREVYELLKHEILDSMSIGFRTLDSNRKSNGVREITEIDLAEISIVTMPANNEALVSEVKMVSKFKNFPLAERNHPWDSSEAIKRVRKFIGAMDEPNKRYKEAFLYYDEENEDNFGGYKLPFLDVVDGKLKAIPRAIIAAAAVMDGARGGIKNVSNEDRKKIKSHIEKYYKKMDMESPFNSEKNQNNNLYEEGAEDMSDEELKNKKKLLAGNDKRNMATKAEVEIEIEEDEDDDYEDESRDESEDLEEENDREDYEDYDEDEDEDEDEILRQKRKQKRKMEEESSSKKVSFKKMKTLREIRKALKGYGIGSEKAKEIMSSVINAHKNMVKRKKSINEDDVNNDLVHIDNYFVGDKEKINEKSNKEDLELKRRIAEFMSKVDEMKNKIIK